eukprot:603356-Prymnesium_polylepis.1
MPTAFAAPGTAPSFPQDSSRSRSRSSLSFSQSRRLPAHAAWHAATLPVCTNALHASELSCSCCRLAGRLRCAASPTSCHPRACGSETPSAGSTSNEIRSRNIGSTTCAYCWRWYGCTAPAESVGGTLISSSHARCAESTSTSSARCEKCRGQL